MPLGEREEISLARAVPTDLYGVAAIVHDIWGQDLLPSVFEARITGATSVIWVAKERDDVLGFVSAFLTADRANLGRWEVDLLAVRRVSQGQGIGQRLIRQVCQDAAGRDIPLARAAIRVDNVPSRRAFEKAGFCTDGECHSLLLWSPRAQSSPAPCPNGVSLLPVDTLTYRGLWIEGLANLPHAEQWTVVATARARTAEEHRLNTGAMISSDEEHLLMPDLRDQATLQGQYHWFVKSISQT